MSFHQKSRSYLGVSMLCIHSKVAYYDAIRLAHTCEVSLDSFGQCSVYVVGNLNQETIFKAKSKKKLSKDRY